MESTSVAVRNIAPGSHTLFRSSVLDNFSVIDFVGCGAKICLNIGISTVAQESVAFISVPHLGSILGSPTFSGVFVVDCLCTKVCRTRLTKRNRNFQIVVT